MGGVESDYSVCPRPLLQFLQFFHFMSDRLYQVTPGYIMLSQFTSEGRDVELDKKNSWEGGYKDQHFLFYFTSY